MRKLQKSKDKSRFWQARAAGNGKYSVYHGFEGFVVSVVDKTCTCKAWELSGIPCLHAIAVMLEERHNVEDFVHDYYLVDMYKRAFANAINPVNGRNQWVKEDIPTFIPPDLMCHWKIWPSRGGPRKVIAATKKFRVQRNCQGKGIARLAQCVEFQDTQRGHVSNRYKRLCSYSFSYLCPRCTYVTDLRTCMQAEVNQAASDAPSQPLTFTMIPTPRV